MGAVEPLYAIHPRRQAARQLRFLAAAGADVHAMSFDQIVANDMVILGSAQSVATAIRNGGGTRGQTRSCSVKDGLTITRY
jgi:hypothetical protein